MKQYRTHAACLIMVMLMYCAQALAQNEFLPQTVINQAMFKHIPNEFIRNGDSLVSLNIIGDRVYLDDDIYLGDTSMFKQYQLFKEMPRGVAFSSSTNDNLLVSTRWPNAVIPFRISSDFSDSEERTIRKAMNHIMSKTHVCFIPRTDHANYIRFKKVSVSELGFTGGQSHLGMWPYGPQDLSISRSDFGQGLVVHELCHAIGFIHEQNRSDRDEYVKIMYENIKDGMASQFYHVPFTSTNQTSYDYYSIMHYRPKDFSRNGEPVIVKLRNPEDQDFGRSDTLTRRDILGINRVYPSEKHCASIPLNGPILAREELRLNETIHVYVYAKNAHNFIDVFVRAGQRFRFTVSSSDYWYNKSGTPWEDKVNANGRANDAGQSLSRHSSCKIMALIGEVFSENNNILAYAGKFFRIGTSRTWTAPKTGYLQLFANDILAGGYSDNSGKVKVTIKRIR